jgi:very-short-patch-repair endonuclease
MRRQVGTGPRELADLATRQHGVVAHWQLLELGFSARGIIRGVERGRLHRVHRGVYAVGHRLLSVKGRMLAAVLACGRDAVLSHRSAGHLWEVRPTASGLLEVTVAGSGRRHPGIRVHRVRRLDSRDCTVVDGIPVTTVARTLLDLAEVITPRQLENAIEGAERRRLFDLDAINDLCGRSPGRRGRKPLKAALADYKEPPRTRRELERLFIDVCRNGNLPRPVCNTIVNGHEVDATWPNTNLIVELDSWEFHGKTRAAFEDDRRRDAKLLLAGYRVVRLTWRRLHREPDAVAGELRALLAAR